MDYGNAAVISRRFRIRLPFLIAALIGLAFVMVGSTLVLIIEGFTLTSIALAAVPLAVIYLSVIGPYTQSWSTLRRLRAAGFEPALWTFSQVGIRICDAQSDTQIKWSYPSKAIVTKQYVLLYLGKQFHTFAAPMFTTPTDWHNFRTAIIRNFIGCRSCGYDLHGTTSDSCPECGKPVD